MHTRIGKLSLFAALLALAANSPAADQFTPERGYSGNLSLIGRSQIGDRPETVKGAAIGTLALSPAAEASARRIRTAVARATQRQLESELALAKVRLAAAQAEYEAVLARKKEFEEGLHRGFSRPQATPAP